MAETRKTDVNQKDTQARKRKSPVVKNAAPVAQALDQAMVQLALVDPASAPQASLLHLQRHSGNRAVHRLIQRSRDEQRHSVSQSADPRAIVAQPSIVQQEVVSLPRQSKRTNSHPNRGTLPKAESINRPTFFSEIVRLKSAFEPLPLSGDTEMGGEMVEGMAYVPPVAPPPEPPGLPKGKPNKSNGLVRTKLALDRANAQRLADEANSVQQIALNAESFEVTVLEKSAEVFSQIGSNNILQPNAE